MSKTYSPPYGKSNLHFEIDKKYQEDLLIPLKLHVNSYEISIISSAIRKSLNYLSFPEKIESETNMAIMINDKTKPATNNLLFPSLLNELQKNSIKNNILILIGNGMHLPIPASEYSFIPYATANIPQIRGGRNAK